MEYLEPTHFGVLLVELHCFGVGANILTEPQDISFSVFTSKIQFTV
jgi:hypothetical protein